MFGDLKKYRDPGFLKEHPNVEIFYQGQWITCPIILAKVTDETDGTPYQKGERMILSIRSFCFLYLPADTFVFFGSQTILSYCISGIDYSGCSSCQKN